MKFLIFIGGNQIAEVSGTEIAYEVFRKAADLADLIGEDAYLVNGETGEIIVDTVEDDSPLDWYTDEDFDECGFDPYGGCYTYDC